MRDFTKPEQNVMEMEPEDMLGSCGLCDGELETLGQLGRRLHLCCCRCHMQYSININ